MIPELGHFSLIVALCLALMLASFPVIGAARQIPGWMAMARPVACGQLMFIGVAYGCLTYAFIVNDFSVAYVARNSNTALPLIYRFSGVWGAHEGRGSPIVAFSGPLPIHESAGRAIDPWS